MVPSKVWGTKRMCPSCGAKFYDLRKTPIECPKCEFTFEPEVPKRPAREAVAKAAAPVVKKAKASDEILEQAKDKKSDYDIDANIDVGIDVDDDDDAEDDEQNKGVLEDASDLMGGDDDVPAVREQASDGAPDDR